LGAKFSSESKPAQGERSNIDRSAGAERGLGADVFKGLAQEDVGEAEVVEEIGTLGQKLRPALIRAIGGAGSEATTDARREAERSIDPAELKVLLAEDAQQGFVGGQRGQFLKVWWLLGMFLQEGEVRFALSGLTYSAQVYAEKDGMFDGF
jgi:hypothetical protein